MHWETRGYRRKGMLRMDRVYVIRHKVLMEHLSDRSVACELVPFEEGRSRKG